MVIDTSAFVAIVMGEPERETFVQAIASRPVRLTSAATILETAMVILGRKGEQGLSAFHAFVAKANIETAPFTAEQVAIATDAFRRFGKGRHPAGLNFGDCFVYALAKATDEPLLFKGGDFSQTDIKRAL